MSQVNGSTTGGSPVHADNPNQVGYVTRGDDGQGNGRVKPIITTLSSGNNKEGIIGGINIKGGK